jgi:hypothetical protein
VVAEKVGVRSDGLVGPRANRIVGGRKPPNSAKGHIAVARPVRLAFRWRPRLSDPDDDMVLETAINGSASAIVTFNQRDFAAGIKGFSCAVILPAMALQQIRSVIP